MLEYDFDKQLAIGQEWERKLDRHFSRHFSVGVHPAKDTQRILERAGVDRIFKKRPPAFKDGKTFTALTTVEYKSDQIGHATGNVFLEMELQHNDGRITTGWSPKILAQILVYLFTESKQILICNPTEMKNWLYYWGTKCPWRKCKNKEYEALGILVPRESTAETMGFDKVCVERIEELTNGE